MKCSANLSMLFCELPLLERFAAARNAQFSGVEIQFPYEESLPSLLNAQRNSDLPVVLINVPAGDLMSGGPGLACTPGKQAQFKQAVDQALPYAQSLNVECINVLAGRVSQPDQRARHYDIFLGNLEYCADMFASIGVKTIFEALNDSDVPQFLLNRCDHMIQVLDDLNHPNLAMQYDVYHMAKMKEPFERQLEEHIDKIGHLQFADIPHRHEPGTGDLCFEKLLEQLRKLNYQRWIGAEYKPSSTTIQSLGWMEYL